MNSNLQNESYLSYCRTCAANNAMISIFDDMNQPIRKYIEEYLPIKVTQSDEISTYLCEQCAHTLKTWNEFVLGAFPAESRLRELLAEHQANEDEILEQLAAFSSDGGTDSDNLPLIKIASPLKKKKGRTKKETSSSTAPDTNRSLEDSTVNHNSQTKRKVSKKEICPLCLKSVRCVDSHKNQHDLCNGLAMRYCLICGEDVDNFEKMSQHLYTHMDFSLTEDLTSPSQCMSCLTECSNFELLCRHLIVHINGISRGNPKKLVHCVACGKGVLRLTLIRHLGTHSGEKRFTCEQCGKRYAQESGLIRHVRITHEGVRRYKCPICPAIFQSNTDLRAHQGTHPDPRPFQCDECGRTFQSQKHLYHHHKYHHTENGLRVECQECDRVFSSASVLRRHHKVVHLRLKEFQCDICSAQLSTKQYLQDHLRTHTDERPEVCTVCGKTFQMAGNLRQHMKTHMERSQVCDICGKRFARRCQLIIHMGSHRGLPPQQCAQCGQSFLLKADLQKHSVSVHGDGSDSYNGHEDDQDQQTTERNLSGRRQTFVCETCGKQLSKRYNYDRHLKVHTGETLTCHTCGKQYRGRSSLDIHVRMVHTQERGFLCYVCSKAFGSRTALENHLRTHTGERPFNCETCGQTFRTRSGLLGHRKIHLNSLPFECSICNARFRLKHSYKDHITRHTSTKQFPCPTCGKAFITRNDLWKHMQIHKTGKEFTCPTCDTSFTLKRYLVVHMKTHAQKK